MTRYLVTTQIEENWFKRLGRRLGIWRKGNFEMLINFGEFKKGDILSSYEGNNVKILKIRREKRKNRQK